MRILLLNQTFHPDVVATSHYVSEAAVALARRNHNVTVITSRRAYDDPEHIFPPRENWRGVQILRINSTGLGKGAKWRRAVDFASFMIGAAFRAATLPRHDAVLALTSPPLISVLGALLTRLRGGRFFYWIMDFNPDEALAAGWLRPNSISARVLESLSKFSLRSASCVITLDNFMRQRVLAKGIPAEKVIVLPPWTHGHVRFDPEGRERFRDAHGLRGKFVVMYSGNHSPCHPLDTLLKAAAALQSDPDVVFLFIGGGSEYSRVEALANSGQHPNIRCLPYQPTEILPASLSAADLQTVVMGEQFVGLIHPCKIYNLLSLGTPILSIAPSQSHLGEIHRDLTQEAPEFPHLCVPHGRTEEIVQFIQKLRAEGDRSRAPLPMAQKFSEEAIVPQLVKVMETGCA